MEEKRPKEYKSKECVDMDLDLASPESSDMTPSSPHHKRHKHRRYWRAHPIATTSFTITAKVHVQVVAPVEITQGRTTGRALVEVTTSGAQRNRTTDKVTKAITKTITMGISTGIPVEITGMGWHFNREGNREGRCMGT